MKIQPWETERSPSPEDIVKRINGVASDLVTLLHYEQDDYETYQEKEWFQEFVTSVYARLELITRKGFPDDQGFFESFIKWLQGLIDELINFVQDIIDFLVEQTVGAIKFLFYVWDDLVKPALGSAITLIKEVAKFTVKLILSIMTKALTGDLQLPIISNYINYAKSILLDIIQDTDWGQVVQSLDQFNSITLETITELLAYNIATSLGPLDSMVNIFTIADVLELSGIINDLKNLIGPNLVLTIVSELLAITIGGSINALIGSWKQNNNLKTFLNILNPKTWLTSIIEDIFSITEGFNTGNFDNITTFSNFIRTFGVLDNDLLDFSLWGGLIEDLMKNVQQATNTFVFNQIINICAIFIGGFLYLTNPIPLTIPVSPKIIQSISSDGFATEVSSKTLEIDHTQTYSSNKKIFDISFFLFNNIYVRILDMIGVKYNVDSDTKLFISIFSAMINAINWVFVMGKLLVIDIPWGILYEYGQRFGYLGANVYSFLFNQIGLLLDGILTCFKDYFIDKVPVIAPIYDEILAIATHLPPILAALITGVAVFTPLLDWVPFMGGDNFWDHINQEDPVWAGDLFFGIQASFLHLTLNLNYLLKKLINWDFLGWFWNLLNLNTDIKRALSLFAVNTALDVGMAWIFLNNA